MENKITYPVDGKGMSKELVYRHCVARGESLKNVDDKTLVKIDGLCSYLTADGVKIISILGYKWNEDAQDFETAMTHYVSNSSYFRTELEKIVDIFGDKDIVIRIRKSISKAGRTFVTCELA